MMADGTQIDDRVIEAAAAAIANERASRRGAPAVSNVLVVLRTSPRLQHLYREVMDDARVAIVAADEARRQEAALVERN